MKTSYVPRWINWLMLVVCALFLAHIATEFFIDLPESTTRAIAYIASLVFPFATIVLLALLLVSELTMSAKLHFSCFFFFYVVLYALHYYWLHEPNGWGWKSGYLLFVYNSALLLLYYFVLRKVNEPDDLEAV